jgi:hypothetical protein
MAKKIIIGCMMLGILVLAQSAIGVQYDYELSYSSSSRDSGLREALSMDDWLERGRAAVTESPVFPDGVRLTAWGGEDEYEPGLASAIYYFKVPRWAQYLKITIQYHDASRDDTIAGRLWIKSADRDQYETLGAGEEAPLYGDSFVLRSERNSETIIVPRGRHVEDDTVEMHIVAEGQDCLDVRDVRLVFLETRPDNFTIVHHTDNGYWDQWPRYRYAYHYYYWGPLFWPKTYVVYECWDVPSPFYWITWRPWFFINIIQVQHHYPWWGPRRYTVIYHVDVKQPPIKRKPLIHQRLKERNVYITKTIRPTPLPRNTVPPPVPVSQPRQQEVRLNKKTAPPPTVEATINRDPIQRHQQEQSVRVVTGQAKQQSRVQPINRAKTAQVPAQKQVKQPNPVNQKTDKSVRSTPPLRPDTRQLTQKKKEPEKSTVTKHPKTVKKPQVVNTPDVRSAHPSSTVTQRIQKEQPQPGTPRTTGQQPRFNTVNREKTVQPPVQKQLKKSGNEIPKTKSEVRPLAIRRDNQEQLALEKQQPKRPATSRQIKAVQSSQVTNKSNARSASPSHTATQPGAVKQQPQSRSVARETLRGKTAAPAVQAHDSKQEETIQRHAKTGQRAKPQFHQKARQPRSYAEQRRYR